MQWMPDTVYLEKGALAPDVRKALEAAGYNFTDDVPWGAAEGLVIADKAGKRMLYGGNDRRSGAGSAAGY
jgi:hypothetical protein